MFLSLLIIDYRLSHCTQTSLLRSRWRRRTFIVYCMSCLPIL